MQCSSALLQAETTEIPQLDHMDFARLKRFQFSQCVVQRREIHAWVIDDGRRLVQRHPAKPSSAFDVVALWPNRPAVFASSGSRAALSPWPHAISSSVGLSDVGKSDLYTD